MPDISLTCRDCSSPFLFTEGEQEFYARKGFTNQPTRCPMCRAARKGAREGDGYSSGGYTVGSYTSGGYSTGGYGGRRELFSATCAACGQEARIPFQPRTDKPVYCSDCFETRRGSASSGRGGRSW